MTKHYPRPRSHYHNQQQHQEQKHEQHRDRGWYCKEHDTKYLCDICGYENNKQGEVKYYFVNND
ncbi:MAG TPA: hypothetical protein VE544_11415 [Nitrososphaeraceae archaeon]|nr:hypothetical protein [Nitrososphaeraceae archaeon]